jgi:hypothetical protein
MERPFVPKYCDSQSILLVNSDGKLRKLYCPFQVKFCGNSNDFNPSVVLWVEQVGTTTNDNLIYWILGKPFEHTCFEIMAIF